MTDNITDDIVGLSENGYTVPEIVSLYDPLLTPSDVNEILATCEDSQFSLPPEQELNFNSER